MKYIITESKLEIAITEYINELFPVDNIHSTNPEEYDDEEDWYIEDETRVLFYIGDYVDDNNCFYWYDCQYFDSDGPARDICPTVSLEYVFERQLNGLFGDKWHEPFRQWFIKNFHLPVKTIDS
jgi:hypothetical protein